MLAICDGGAAPRINMFRRTLSHEEYAPADMDFMKQFLANEGIKVEKAVKSADVLAAEARRDALKSAMLEGGGEGGSAEAEAKAAGESLTSFGR